MRREHDSNLAWLETAKKLLTLNISSIRLYKLQSKISGHAVAELNPFIHIMYPCSDQWEVKGFFVLLTSLYSYNSDSFGLNQKKSDRQRRRTNLILKGSLAFNHWFQIYLFTFSFYGVGKHFGWKNIFWKEHINHQYAECWLLLICQNLRPYVGDPVVEPGGQDRRRGRIILRISGHFFLTTLYLSLFFVHILVSYVRTLTHT